jgi:hypothetical protein
MRPAAGRTRANAPPSCSTLARRLPPETTTIARRRWPGPRAPADHRWSSSCCRAALPSTCPTTSRGRRRSHGQRVAATLESSTCFAPRERFVDGTFRGGVTNPMIKIKPDEWLASDEAGQAIWDTLVAAADGDVTSLRRLLERNPRLGRAQYWYTPAVHDSVVDYRGNMASCLSHGRGSLLRDRCLFRPKYGEGSVWPPDRYWNGTRTAVKSSCDAAGNIRP